MSCTSLCVRPSHCIADTKRNIHTEVVFSHSAMVPRDRTRDSIETWEAPSEHQEALFHSEGDQALHTLLR